MKILQISKHVFAYLITYLVGCGQDPKFAGTTAESQRSPSADAVREAHGSDGHSIDDLVPAASQGPGESQDDKGKEKGDGMPQPLSVTRDFVSGRVLDGRSEFVLDKPLISQDFKMARSMVLVENSKTLRQGERPAVTDTFKQGTAGRNSTEIFEQAKRGVLDLLLVVDNSGSMEKEHEKLSTKLSDLLSEIKNSDWRIGVITTDPNLPCLRALIKKGDADYDAAFKQAVRAGTDGSSNERGALTGTFGLGIPIDIDGNGTKEVCGTKWLRQNSTVAVLVVSDEDNCSETDSDGKNSCGKKPWAKVQFLADNLATIREVGVQARVYGLIHVPHTDCPVAYAVGTEYQKLIDITGGVSGSICDDNYTTTLHKISSDVSLILSTQFSLKSLPVPNSLKVYVDDVLITSGYSIAGTTVTFSNPPASGAKIKISYRTGETPRFASVTLKEPVANGTVVVAINGTTIDPTSYSIDYLKRQVTFTRAPADNADILVKYKKDIELGRTFLIGMNAIPESIKATIDSTDVGIESYHAGTGIIKLTMAPPELAIIKVKFNSYEKGDPITTFPLMPSWKAVRQLSATEKLSGKMLAVSWADGTLSVDPKDFSDGRVLIASYLDESSGPKKEFNLTVTPVDGKVTVAGRSDANAELPCDSGMISLENSRVMTLCDLADVHTVVIEYKYWGDLTKDFAIPDLKEPDNFRWSVLVDGTAAKEYVRSGNTIKFPEVLPAGTKVRIVASRDGNPEDLTP